MDFVKTLCIFMSLAIASTIGCGPRSDETSPEMVQDMLKLRGFKFTEPEFIRAVSLEDAAAVKAFLQGGMNPNAKNENGETALTYAIQYKDPKVIKVLIEKADFNMKDDLGNSPIHLAVTTKKDEIFDLLLEKNADVNLSGQSGKTKNQTALYAAVLKDREDLVQKLLEKGANPNIADGDGAYPLSEAVVRKSANPQIVKRLLDGGANVNAQEANKATALIYAASNKQISPQTRLEIVQMLINKGADVTIKDEKGKNALDWAKQNRNDDMFEILR